MNCRLHNTWFLNTGILLVSLILILKLGYIQIIQGELYREKADAQYIKPSSRVFSRGSIFFEEKTGRTISAATVVPDYTLVIDPSKIKDREQLADRLIKIIAFDRADFILRAGREGDQYEVIAKHVSQEEVDKIRLLNEKGIVLENNKKRFYPGGKTGAQVFGFVSSDGNALVGMYGLERYYNETLMRTESTGSSSFFADLFLKSGSPFLFNRTREGDLFTTIEPTVQSFLEQTLEQDILKKYNAESVSAIIMSPTTGEIYAMATVPGFDLNFFSKEKNSRVFTNPLVDSTYEMGSIIKPFTMAAGIDTNAVTAATTYDDKGFRTFNTHRMKNFDGKGRGVVVMQEVFNQSLNTGAIFVMERINKDRFLEYFKAFGFGEETGIDLPSESVGNMKNLESGRDIEYAAASFGQGISLTPIAIIRAAASLANGGVLVTPHIVKRTEYGIGFPREFVPNDERRVIKKETSKEISRMLTVAVDKGLLNGTLKMDHYSIAAKTGTAQQVEGKGYSETQFLHTFFGYFPSYNPRFIVFIMAKNPQKERYAANTIALPFMKITKFLLNYYEIPPDR